MFMVIQTRFKDDFPFAYIDILVVLDFRLETFSPIVTPRGISLFSMTSSNVKLTYKAPKTKIQKNTTILVYY
jgi:hypothetical protein